MPGVFGPKMMPASMKNGIVGSPMRRPSRARTPGGEERAAERDELVTHVTPTTWRTNARQVLLSADDDESIAGPQHLGRFGRDDRLGVAQDRGDGHLRAAPDLELGDRLRPPPVSLARA